MIRQQTVTWTLLPGGLTPDGQLAASVFVSVRLKAEAPATLADFPDFVDWPATLAGLDLEVVRPDGTTEAPISMAVSASSTRWAALFPPETVVRTFRFEDIADRPLVSYPVNGVLAHLSERWATLAHRALDDLPLTSSHASPTGPLGPDDRRFTLADHFFELRSVLQRGLLEGVEDGDELSARLRDRLDRVTAQARALRAAHNRVEQPLLRPFPSGGTPADDLAALYGFHARPMREEPKEFPTTAEQVRDELAEKHDFHHQLSVLGDHPALLRGLGLVIDLQLRPEVAGETADGDPPTPLRLRIRRPSAFADRRDDPGAEQWNVDATPATWCRLASVDGQAVFSAVERAGRGDFAHGFLRMDPARLSLAAVDVDGLALKALNLAVTLQRQEERSQRPVEEPAREGVPTPRTGGIALVHSGAADDLHTDAYAARAADDALETDPENPADLAAEDLVRGYRVDVLTDGTWRSLHQREVGYRSLRDPNEDLDVVDEGQVELSLTSEVDRPSAPADPDRPLYAHEVLTTWDGWSLAAPRPGTPVPQEPAAGEATADLTSLQLGITTRALPGSLPRLRFGGSYQVRVRTVDLAGQSHTSDVADHLAQIFDGTGDPRYVVSAPAQPLLYRRFEPVPPPELVPRWIFGPGEGAERLVLHSTPGLTAAEYAEASQGAVEEALRFHDTAQRHLLAGKAPLALVEAHGLLDEAIDAVRGLDPDAAAAAVQAWYDIAARESGSVRALPDSRFVPTGTHVPEGQPPEEQGYACVDADSVDLPYLPDPWGVGAKLRLDLGPGQPEQALEVAFPDGGAWHLARPLRLDLVEGAAGLAVDAASGIITASLPQGRSARLRLSSLFAGDPDLMGIVGWCREHLPPDEAEAVVEAVKASTHWMVTPWRDLLLVHASQRPIAPPELYLDTESVPGFERAAVLTRRIGATSQDLRGQLWGDMPSTAQLDVGAVWDETVDDPAQRYEDPSEMVHEMRRPVLALPVPDTFGTPWQPELAPLVEPLDERGVGFMTRGHEDESADDLRKRLRAAAAAPGLSTPERRRIEAAAAQVEQLRAHELGDTRYRRITYTPVASTRFREYFDPAMLAEDGQAVGEPMTVEVLSSAPPAKPVILQVLPLLGYNQERADEVTTSRREGLGLRVWLARPWYSSGAGELLAVVCDRGGPLTAESALSREITLITGDPAHGSALPLPLRASSFADPAVVRRDVTLAGGGLRRDIAAFAPTWDAGRQAWYVDLRFDTGEAYFPFVRLALARYQPMSPPGLELSPMVSTAFLQSLPDRTLTCLHGDGSVEVTLNGPAPTSAVDAAGVVRAGGNEVVAVVESQPLAYADPVLGWSAAGPEVALVAAPGGGTTLTYTGTVPVPDAPDSRLRVTVREFESHPSDDRSADPAPALVATRRLVHADTVPL